MMYLDLQYYALKEDYGLWCQQSYFVELLLVDGSEQKHNYVDTVTIIGIGNKSII